MPQFDATIKPLRQGIKSITVNAAVKNIEGWEATPENLEEPAAMAIIKDLEDLTKHLHAKELDGEAIRKLVVQLGKETVATGKKTESRNARKVQALGETLGHAAVNASAA